MSKFSLWKNVFEHREKVPVKVGGKTELLTNTQSYRFSEISEARDAPITRAFGLVLGRAPTATERAAAETVVARHGLRALCRALLNTNEFLVLP